MNKAIPIKRSVSSFGFLPNRHNVSSILHESSREVTLTLSLSVFLE